MKRLFFPIAGWKARADIIQYCVDVTDKGTEETRAAFIKEELEAGQETEAASERRKRHQKAVLYAEEVKVLVFSLAGYTVAYYLSACAEKPNT